MYFIASLKREGAACLALGLLNIMFKSTGCSGTSLQRIAKRRSRSRDGLERQMDGEVHLLLFLHAPSLVARGHVESYLCMCHQINTGWVGIRFVAFFFFKMGSLSNNIYLIRV